MPLLRRPGWICAAVALACLAGCGQKKPAASRTSSPAPQEITELDAGELFTKLLPEGLQARVTRREYAGYREGGVFVIDGDYQFFLTVINSTAAPARATCPKYLLGKGEGWRNPNPGEGREPEFLYFMVVRDRELRIPAGQETRVELREAHYLGNVNRPPYFGPGTEPELRISVPAADSQYVRAAEALEALKPSLAPWFPGLAFSLISDASPDEIQRKRILAWEWVGLKRLREALEGAGVRPRQASSFEEAAKKREGILGKLRAAVDAAEAIRAVDERSCAGDVEVAVAVAAFLKPEADRTEKSPLPLVLGRLKVRDPRILDRLFEFALRDGHEFSRVQAAMEGAKLGDPRCIPLLVQYSRNPAMADGDVAKLAQECTGTLVELWEAQGKFARGGKWKEAIDRFGGLDAPDLAAVPQGQLAELRTFLESGKNLRRK
ncbi:MAG: hypothetical protein AAB074_15595 [Planctomycetota bacterium]